LFIPVRYRPQYEKAELLKIAALGAPFAHPVKSPLLEWFIEYSTVST
jgi:hypothetical protein